MSTSTRSFPASPAIVLGLALLASWPEPALASPQASEAPLQGVVTDDLTGEVIGSARVTIVGKELETRTSDAGTFAFPDVPFGTLSVRVQAQGYPAITDEVVVSPGEVVFMHVVLPQVSLILGELLIFGEPSPLRPVSAEPYARTAADILAQQVPGLHESGGVVGRNEAPLVLRGISSLNMSS